MLYILGVGDGAEIWRESSLRPLLIGKRAARSMLGAARYEREARLEEVVVALYMAGRREEADSLLVRLDETGTVSGVIRPLRDAAFPGRVWRTALGRYSAADDAEVRRWMLARGVGSGSAVDERDRALRDVFDRARRAYATGDTAAFLVAIDGYLARWPDRAWDVGPLTLDLAARAGDYDRLEATIGPLLTLRIGLSVVDFTRTRALSAALVAGAYAASPAVAPASTTKLDDLFAAIEQCLRGAPIELSDVLRTLGKRLRPGATDAEIVALEGRLGVALPADYRALLARSNGIARRSADSVALLPADRVIRVADSAKYASWRDAIGEPYAGVERDDADHDGDLDGDPRRLAAAIQIGSAGDALCVLVPPRDDAHGWECWRVGLLDGEVSTYASVYELLLDG